MAEDGERVMTAEYAWDGGHYELELHYPRGTPLHESLAAIWSFADLEGPVTMRSAEVAEQDLVDPLALAEELDGQVAYGLHGTIRLLSGERFACGSTALRDAGGDQLVGLWIPLGSLERIPRFALLNPSAFLDEPLLALAEHVFERVPFTRGLIGFELDASEPLRLSGPVPPDRTVGVIDVQDRTLNWYPPTPDGE